MATSHNWYEQVLTDVREASKKPPTSKTEAVAYFQREFAARGKGSWKQQLVHQLADITGMKPKNLEKRFDPQRLHNPEPRNAGQYKELGIRIGWKPPKHGYHVHFDGWVLFSNVCEKRDFDVYITDEWSKQVASDPRRVFPAMFLLYMEEDDQDKDIDEQDPSVSFCEPPDKGEDGEEVKAPDITITANEKEKHSGHSGPARRFSFFDKR